MSGPLLSWLGLDSTVCLFSETCGRSAVMGRNGSVYSCERYVNSEYEIGNVLNNFLNG